MKLKFTLAACAALALAACGRSEDATPPEATATPTGALAEADAAVTDAILPTDAQGFVDVAAANDMFEIEAGKLAQTLGVTQAVKDFGKMMETDHTKSSADLRTAAAQASATVNAQLTPKQRADLEALKNAGADFDRLYKEQQLAAHQEALSLLRNYASAGDQQELKDFAGKTAVVVQTHLEHTQTLP